MKNGGNPVDWLSYTIKPEDVPGAKWPAMWGNGQTELAADLERPCINQVVCFGFGEEGLSYDREQHLVPAVYDDETGRKYLLDAPRSSGARDATVNFRCDRQTWRYEFDDLTISVALVLPRMRPGYFFKLDLLPHDHNASNRWRIYHELRGHQANLLFATGAGSNLAGGAAWCMSKTGKGEAIGSSVNAQAINLGLDYDHANDIMIKTVAERNGDAPDTVYFARAFGATVDVAREGLAGLLSSPESLEAEAAAWWDRYLNEVPRLDVPDEMFARTFLWSWPSFRINRIDIPVGRSPAGLCTVNNCRIKVRTGGRMDPMATEAIQILHDTQPARETMLFLLRESRKTGLMGMGSFSGREYPGNYPECLGWFCGLLHKYLLTTGDLALLSESIGDGITFLQRLEDGLEAQLPFRDEETGLFWNDGEMKRFPGLYPGEQGGMGPALEAVTRYRGARGSFHSETSAMVYGTFLVMADIEELARNMEKAAGYRGMAEELKEAIRKHLWDEELGTFIDRLPDKSAGDYIGIGGFITGLFANHVSRPGGLATPEQAERLAAWCSHPDFASDFGTLCLARSSPYFDPADYKGYNSNFDMHWSNQVPAGLYAHGCYEEAHRQLFKLWRRLGENAGLGPRYRGECYHADTGEILPNRFVNYPCILSALSTVFEGVFGMRWTREALTVHVNSPWPWARLSNIRIRNSLLEIELQEDGALIARINHEEVARSDDRKLSLPWEEFDGNQ